MRTSFGWAGKMQAWFILLADGRGVCRWNCEIRVSYLSALEMCSQQGAIQIHVYLCLTCIIYWFFPCFTQVWTRREISTVWWRRWWCCSVYVCGKRWANVRCCRSFTTWKVSWHLHVRMEQRSMILSSRQPQQDTAFRFASVSFNFQLSCSANTVPGEPKKNPPYDFCWYYSNAWEFLYEILHDC